MTELSVCVYCGTNNGSSPAYAQAAAELGRALAAAGVGLVYGGGRLGLMGAVADAVLAAGGTAIGVIPESMVDLEVAHLDLTELIVAESMHHRKAMMAERASGFIALPGGFGTMEELLEVLTWNQLGFIRKPVVVFDVEGFYAPLFAMFERAVTERFVRPEHAALGRRASTAADAVALATGSAPASPSKWID